MNIKNCKEELIEITIALINENKGEVEKVTIRDIAKRSGVSVGLIHYHFGNKDNLITECVQRIISQVVQSFRPDMEAGKSLPPFQAGKARLIKAAQEVYRFMFAHPSITRISILGDYAHYTNQANSYFSLEGFSSVIGNAIEDKQEKHRIAFLLINSMQVAFHRSLTDPIFLSYDFAKEEERNAYIAALVEQIMKEPSK